MDQNAYGPGDGHRINTYNDIHVKLDIGTTGDFSINLSQGSNNLRMADNCASGMLGDLQNGMAIVISNWSAYDADWLWGTTCQASACGLQQSSYKNLSITTGGDTPIPPVPPTPSHDYTFGDNCATSSDDYCDGSCNCKWSWPRDQSWSSPDAACRCDYGNSAVQAPTPAADEENCPHQYMWGTPCASKSDGKCNGFCDCRWTIPKDCNSAANSDDDCEGMCRCMP